MPSRIGVDTLSINTVRVEGTDRIFVGVKDKGELVSRLNRYVDRDQDGSPRIGHIAVGWTRTRPPKKKTPTWRGLSCCSSQNGRELHHAAHATHAAHSIHVGRAGLVILRGLRDHGLGGDEQTRHR